MISNSITPIDGINTIDLNGRFVTPGLVDLHSHVGTDSWPGLDATSDTNEISTTPITLFISNLVPLSSL